MLSHAVALVVECYRVKEANFMEYMIAVVTSPCYLIITFETEFPFRIM